MCDERAYEGDERECEALRVMREPMRAMRECVSL